MVNAIIKLPYPENEPVYDYVAGSREAEKLDRKSTRLNSSH